MIQPHYFGQPISGNQTQNQTYGILATHCCVCRAALKDAKSVQLGVGPVCQARYGKATIETTPEMLRMALGLLAASPLPGELKLGVLQHKHDAQEVCNRLVYHASVNYNQKTVVLVVTPIIRALGYTVLADKLEVDRTKLSVRLLDTNEFEVKTPFNQNCRSDLRRIPGARWSIIPGKDRSGLWLVPATEREHLFLVLGYHYANESASTEQGVIQIAAKTWHDLWAFRNPPIPQQTVLPVALVSNSFGFVPNPVVPVVPVVAPVAVVKPVCRLEDRSDCVRVFTPFKVAFLVEIKKFKTRRWNGTDKCWEVPVADRQLVADLIANLYGETV